MAAACAAAGRSPDAVTLIAVTKTYPAEDVVRLARLGVTRWVRTATRRRRRRRLPSPQPEPTVTWHFVGRLQRNKCRSVVRYADVVHSVDSVRLALALVRPLRRYRETPMDALVQVSLDGDQERGGAVPDGDDPRRPGPGARGGGGGPERFGYAASWRSHRWAGMRRRRSPGSQQSAAQVVAGLSGGHVGLGRDER